MLNRYPKPNFRDGPNRHNSFGFRGNDIPFFKPEGEFRILCLGGSTTYTGKVTDADASYPARLQTALHARGYNNVRVMNGGTEGWTSWESAINLMVRGISYQPDLVVIYHGINDITARLVWPPEMYLSDNSGRRTANAHVFVPSIWEFSTAIRIAMVQHGLAQPQAALGRNLGGDADTYVGTDFRNQVLDGSYPSGLFARVSASEILGTNKPVYFERNLRSMAAVARAHGALVMFATFAHSPEFEEFPKAASPEYNAAYKEMNDLVLRLGTELDVPVFDFAAKFPVNRDMGLYVDGRHVTEGGAKLKGELFADFIIAANLLNGN